MRKTTALLIPALLVFILNVKAQLHKGDLLIGSDVGGINMNLNSGNGFDILINPKAAFFIKDGVALGPYITLGLAGAKHVEPTTVYGVGALGRYYVSDPKVNLLKQGRVFVEANAGIEGNNNSENDQTTNGLGIGFGPGYAYFITENIALETLFKYNGIVGFGSNPTSSALRLSFGFQIYLSSSKAKSVVTNPNP